jgi:Ca2+-binding EF-hand superfamily protein
MLCWCRWCFQRGYRCHGRYPEGELTAVLARRRIFISEIEKLDCKPFYMGVYHVTQEEYTKVIGKNPSSFASLGSARQKVKGLLAYFDYNGDGRVDLGDLVQLLRRLGR